MTYDEIREALVERRLWLGLSQRQVGERANIKQGYVSWLENGQVIAQWPMLAKWAGALGLDVNVDLIVRPE